MYQLHDDEFQLIAKLIEDYSGIHLKAEKKTLMMGRLNSMLTELKMSSFMEFYKYIKQDKEGRFISQLIDKMTTNHTYFMREPQHFKYLEEEVVPYLKKTVTSRDLRIWCAASSTGEEPYSIAMLLEDLLGKSLPAWDKKILATDISVNVLETAKAAIYPKDRITGIPKMWLMNYFEKLPNDGYRVKDRIKNQVVYRRFNLLEDTFPFKKKFHVIFCRNVMIYFDTETKNTLIQKFYNHLEDGGYLFIGHSESIDRNRTLLKYIKPAVYRKI
jgi:chemotaxis protein methyltransferase CheR